jgi:uncharacterized repeat protein (TIGR01451 family)
MKMIHNIFHIRSGDRSGNGGSGAQPRLRSVFMRKDLLAIGLGMVLSGVTVFSSSAADIPLPGHVPVAVSRAVTQASGRLDGGKTMRLSISLPLRNQEALSDLIRQVSDPKSPNYGHYLTPAQFTDLFGPTEADYQKVVAFAQANKLEIVQKHPNRVILSVSGKAADIEKAFHVTLRTYPHPRENRTFFAPDTDPTVDSTLPILDVSGLDDYSIPHPNLHMRTLAQAQASPAAGSGPGGSYQGTDFRKAYAPGATLTGSGQNVGLVQFDGFFASDIAAYKNQIGLGTGGPNIVIVPIDGGVSSPGGGNGEVSLDISMVMSMAPGAGTIYVYEAPNPSPWVDILNRMVNDNSSKQLSSSWGGGIVGPGAQQIFQQMAVQGQSFFQASGDSDAYTANGQNPILFPSDSPYITVVGGTTLTTDSSANYTSETVWNWGITMGLDGIGSSGGISQTFPIPSWQTNINMAARGGSSTKRNIPDVALTADNVLVFFNSGQAAAFGGTSCAAPLWAGFTALVNQKAAVNSRPPVGFINPAIYAIANSASYNSCFHDTTAGNNTWSGSPTLFNAVAGYDLCTGLGTPNGTNLINTLAAQGTTVSHISPPPAPYGTNLSAVTGGNPNGAWDLFIQDDAPISAGVVANGWILSLTTADQIGTAADLELLMKTASSNTLVGQPITFTLTVTNYGPSISTNVTVVDTLPNTVTVTGTNASVGSVGRAGSVITWNVGTLAVGAGGSLVLTVQPNGAGVLFNQAIAAAGTPDPNPDEDIASATVNVGPITTTLTPLFVRSNGTFHIIVPGPANGITMVIQANSNLVSTNWVNIYTSTPPIDFIDPAASNYVTRFYRALLLP